jgi:hypothetical protein
MCACKETDVRESPNEITPAGGEGQGSRGEIFHLLYGKSPVSSVAEHPLLSRSELPCELLSYGLLVIYISHGTSQLHVIEAICDNTISL